MGVCVPNFRSVSFFGLARRRDTNKYINKNTHKPVKLGISSTGCSPHMDFENKHIRNKTVKYIKIAYYVFIVFNKY